MYCLRFVLVMCWLATALTGSLAQSTIPTGKAAQVPKTTPNGPVSSTSVAGLPAGIVIQCLMKNGKPRPYPCEFRVTSLAVKGNGVAVQHLGGFNPAKPVTLTLSVNKAGQNSLVSGDVRQLAYPVMMTVVRSNKPSLPAPDGYPVLFYPKNIEALISDVASKDANPIQFNYVLTKEPLAINMTQTQVLLFWIKFLVKPNANGQYQFFDNGTTLSTLTGTLSIANPATVQVLNKQKAILAMNDLSEWWATLSFKLIP